MQNFDADIDLSLRSNDNCSIFLVAQSLMILVSYVIVFLQLIYKSNYNYCIGCIIKSNI